MPMGFPRDRMGWWHCLPLEFPKLNRGCIVKAVPKFKFQKSCRAWCSILLKSCISVVHWHNFCIIGYILIAISWKRTSIPWGLPRQLIDRCALNIELINRPFQENPGVAITVSYVMLCNGIPDDEVPFSTWTSQTLTSKSKHCDLETWWMPCFFVELDLYLQLAFSAR